MPWFTRKPAEPEITRDDLERFGRFMFDSSKSGASEAAWAGALTVRAYQWSQRDREAFMAAMVHAAGDGQWSALGAERMVIEALGFLEDDEQFDAVMSASLGFLRSRGIPRARTTGYENRWWGEHGNGEPWLVGRPTPDLASAPITVLADGELRRIANMGPDGNDNDILVARTEDGFKAVIRGRFSEEDPRVADNDWHSAPSLHALYVRIGEALATPAPWMHPELAPYVPLPEPDLR